MRTDRFLTSSLALAVASAAHSQVHVYVDDNAPDGGNGLSWDSTMNDLNLAIDIAHKLGNYRGEIRIAGGTYKPDGGTGDTSRAFVVPNSTDSNRNFTFVGGYAGLANPSNPNFRDTDVFRSVLDADLLGNDTQDLASRSDNSDVLFLSLAEAQSGTGPLSAMTLDGLELRGAAAVAVRGITSSVSLKFTNCTFTDNIGIEGSVMQLRHTFVTLEECSVTNNTAHKQPGVEGGGSLDFDECVVTLRDSEFRNNEFRDSPGQGGDAFGGAVAARFGRLTIENSEFNANRVGGRGGAVYATHASVTITDSMFTLNSANFGYGTGSGGAVFAEQGGVDVAGCEFTYNNAQSGGAIAGVYGVDITDSSFVANNAPQGGAFLGLGYISNCEFISNAGSYGGAMALLAGSSVDTCYLSENTASLGGAIDIGTGIYGTSPIEVRDSLFEGNAARTVGGAIRNPYYDDGLSVNVYGCEFVDNSSDGAFGAVYGAELIADSTFENNSARSEGGAVHTAGSIENCEFIGNSAGFSGGALHTTGSATGCVFTGNEAGTEGGAIYSAEFVDGCEFVGNIATGDGGGVYEAPVLLRSSFSGNTARYGGGAFNPVDVESCLFFQNDGRLGGGGVWLNGNQESLIQSSVFIDNTNEDGKDGADLYSANTELTISSSTFARTTPNINAMLFVENQDTWIESSVIWDESWNESKVISLGGNAPTVFVYSDLRVDSVSIAAVEQSDVYLLGGNISGNPRFADASAGDVRLLPGSPCIDAGFSFGSQGADGVDVYGEPREPFDDPGVINIGLGAGGYLDIGAAESRGTSCLADINGDGDLTPTDFSAWVGAYQRGDAIADQNRDGVLTPTDFSAWVNNYTNGC